MDKILVTGGTGTLGRVVVNKLLNLNKYVKVLSSKSDAILSPEVEMHKGSLMNADELYGAVEGSGTIVHCASNPRDFQAVDITGTRNLLSAIKKNTATHLIYISIVGVHKSDYPYYKAKLEVERMIADSGNPYTILRTTQFHNFIYQLIETCTVRDKSILEIPSGMHFQSVDITEVADRLVSLCDKPDYGLLDDFGGPEVLTIEKMAGIYAEFSEPQVQIEPKNIPGVRYDLFRAGVNLCPEKKLGTIGWAEFIKESRVK